MGAPPPGPGPPAGVPLRARLCPDPLRDSAHDQMNSRSSLTLCSRTQQKNHFFKGGKGATPGGRMEQLQDME